MPRRSNAQIAADAERERIEAEAKAADADADATPDADPEPEPAADPDAVVRENRHAWWCPRCDHSNTLLTAACGGCGAARAGERVT